MLTRPQWRRVKRLFADASRLVPSQQGVFLDGACKEQVIREEVESLLRPTARSQDFLKLATSVGGKTLSHYEIHERIDEGGMAFVYKARDLRLERWVAIKVLQPWEMGRADSGQKLLQEARLASALNHPNIVTVYEVGQEYDLSFIVMEYLSGKTLERLIPSKGFGVPTAISLALQITGAMDAAHTAGILHGDLKPANIIVTDRGEVKLLDFGLGWMISERPSREPGESSPRPFGTKAYMAPELLDDVSRDSDPRSEIFTIGLILHEMLAGKHAFEAATADKIAQSIRTRTSGPLPAKVPESLRATIRRCLERSPDRRFPSMRALHDALSNEAVTRHRTKRSLATVAEAPRWDEFEQTQRLLADVTYQNLPRSRGALETLVRLMKGGVSPETRDSVNAALKDLILTLDDDGGHAIPTSVRTVRKLAFDVLRVSTGDHLDRYFAPTDFESLDLYGMDFSSMKLRGFSFRDCFLVEADFQRASLVRSSLSAARIRNVNFKDADITGADFSNADWFNAVGWTEGQLRSVKSRSLAVCPPDVAAMHRYLQSHYVLSFSAWSSEIQRQLQSAWAACLSPKGLRERLLKRPTGVGRSRR
jgi:serine/threonine protein kinase